MSTNTTTGLSVVSQVAPIFQELRRTAFFTMYLVQAVLFWTYHYIASPTLLTIVTFVIVMCYGGGYGITPAFAADYFGPRNVGPIFG